VITTRYDTNSTMRLIGFQGLDYVYYNDGLEKLSDILRAYQTRHEAASARELMLDAYMLGFVQGMKYARGKKATSKTTKI
jgi:hypothetical protein